MIAETLSTVTITYITVLAFTILDSCMNVSLGILPSEIHVQQKLLILHVTLVVITVLHVV